MKAEILEQFKYGSYFETIEGHSNQSLPKIHRENGDSDQNFFVLCQDLVKVVRPQM